MVPLVKRETAQDIPMKSCSRSALIASGWLFLDLKVGT
jgi:hypothetical protein